MATPAASIGHLEALLAGLSPPVAPAARRIFAVSTASGELVVPPGMEPWIERHFGSVDAVRRQRIVRVTNLVTLEGALFNDLRSLRPRDAAVGDPRDPVHEAVESTRGDPFCDAERRTPADPFGRVTGTHGITASNVAKYDGAHGVLVFEDHDPLAPVDAAIIADRFRTGRAWAMKGFAADPAARYYLLLWNALWRAGGSIVHGHMQMTLTRGMHYPKVESLRRSSLAYAREHGRDYFDDLWSVHEALGLAVERDGSRILAHLVPIKDREVLVLGRPGDAESALAGGVAHAIAALRREGVTAHNLALYMPPLDADGSDWSRFPPLARIVDRGDAGSRTSDIGAMELYAASVIAADPFRLADALRA